MKSHRILSVALAALAFASVPAKAATVSASATAPVINDEDIANYGDVAGTDKWFYGTGADGGVRGQSITTGGAAVRLKSITYQDGEGYGAAPTKTYALRVGKITGTNFALVHSETATQTNSWPGGQYMTWTFATPVILEPYTTYGIDVGMTGSTSAWWTGIPYINVTADEYAGGSSYASGTGGIGTTSITSAIAFDRTFHLDIERPLDPVFSLVAPSPADNATDVYASREIVMTFSQNVTAGAGNLTIWNLTDNSDTLLPANDSRLTYDQNVVRINPAGLLTWNKNYAIRIDAGVFLGNAAAPIPAISDDTTWNFTTLPNDPLLSAIAAIKGHVNNTAPLTGPQISAHKTTIDNQRQRFAENTAIINAIFDLITTYDTVKKPLFVSGYSTNATSFDRNVTTGTAKNSISPENYHWVIYTVMQHAMDLIYTPENLAKYEGTLTNYKFGSHTSFPGPCSPPANPANTHNVQINGSFPVTFGRLTQMWTTPARKPTGTYLSPGSIATVTVPPALVNAGYKVRVGAHAWDLSGRVPVNRLERASRLYSITSTTTKIASPYGGGIYLEVPFGASAGVVGVTVTGGVRAPYFSAKSFHQTTATEWTTERAHSAPWADFQSEKFMFQVPRNWIYNMTGTQATQLMVDWDKAMDAINSLMGFDLNRGKETMYCQTDVIMRSSVHAPGYPAVNVTSNVNSSVSPAGYANNYLVRGPGASPTAASTEFHEQGHAYFFPKFAGETESNVNLLQPAMLHRKFGYNFDTAHRGSIGSTTTFHTIDNTAVAWMCTFNFSPKEQPMAGLEKDYQLKGHAKFMDIARLFGWEGMDAYWRSFMEDDANNIPVDFGTDDLLLRLSRHVGKDIRPLFHFWGIYPENPSTLAAAIAAENIPASVQIHDLLLHYKSIVPANNAAFRSFATSWWGRKPLISGAWEETDHAMQWDETEDFDPGGSTVRPNGDIYVEATADDIRGRVDELIALYFSFDTTPPTLTGKVPADNATGVAANANIVATFDEAIQLGASGNITLDNLSGGTDVVIDVTSPGGQLSVAGNVLTINPSSDLATGAIYAVLFDAGSVTDIATTPNPFAGISDPATWNFSTAVADTTAPGVLSLSPADNNINVAVNTNLVITFNENVQKGNGSIAITQTGGSTFDTIPVGDARVSVSGAVVTINPNGALANDTMYHVEVASGAIKDLANNDFAGISGSTAWNFTTSATTIAAPITVINGNFETVPVPDWYWVPDWNEGGPSYVAPDAASYGWSGAGRVLYLDSGGWVDQNLNYNWTAGEVFTLGIKGNRGWNSSGAFKIQLRQADGTVLWDSGTTPVAATVGNFSWSIDASTFSGAGVVPGSQLNLRIECLNNTVYLDDVTLSTSLTDTTAPTLASANIVDDKSGGPVNPGQPVTYTVTFSEAMNSATVSSSDFDNGGTAAVLIGTPTTTDGVQYQIPVVASSAGTLQLRVPAGATMTDLADLPLDTASAILDDTTITVVAKPIGVTGGDFESPTVTSQTANILLWFDNSVLYSDWLQPANNDFGTSHGSQCALLQRTGGNRGYIYQSLGQLEAGSSSLDWSFDHVRYNPALRTTATGTADMRFFHGVSLAAADGVDIDTLGFTQIGSTISIPGVTSSDAHRSGSVDVSSVPAGATIWVDITYAGTVDNGQEFMLDNIVILAGTPTTGYAAWQATNGATGQTLDQDHDNDGVANGIEYFLGGNTDTTGFTALPGVSNSGGALSVTWTKDAGYTGNYGTDFVVETSETLTGPWTAESSPGNVTITGNEVKYTFPSPLGSKNFSRLKVTGP